MKLIFIDETSDDKFTKYLGFCIASLDARSYPLLKSNVHKILQSISWDKKVEFKGSYLFSIKKGCTSVEIERRIEAADKLLDLNIGKQNSRLRFYYGSLTSANHGRDYINTLPSLVAKSLSKAPKGAGKNLIGIFYDERADVDSSKLTEALEKAVNSKGYILLEHAVQSKSSFGTIGLMFADLVGYLVGRVETITNDADLFKGLTDEQIKGLGKYKKLRTSTTLVSKIKQLDTYTWE